MKKKVYRERYRDGFEVFLNEKGETTTLREEFEDMGVKVLVQEEPKQPNRKTRRTKKGDK